jgi:FixJ family two-component response regulator
MAPPFISRFLWPPGPEGSTLGKQESHAMADDATVFIVDDDPSAADSLRWLLEADGLQVETYASGRELLDAYDPDRAGCFVLDLRMPEIDGLDLQERLLALSAPPAIIFVTGHGDVPKCVAALKAGAVDFIEKPVHHETILGLVRRALEKDRQCRDAEARHRQTAARLATLTPRGKEVMRLLYEGRSIKLIAAACGIGLQTAAKHRARVLAKLEVENEAELVRLLTDALPM